MIIPEKMTWSPGKSWICPGICLFLLGLLLACQSEQKDLALELQGSLKNYMNALESRNAEGLEATVFFPGVRDYSAHVKQLQLDHLEDAQTKEHTSFDPQGVVLIRFLGLNYLGYKILDMNQSEDGMNAHMRISVHFAYDSNITYDLRANAYEDGTRILIPGKPWGKVITIVLGQDAPAPREQLKYLEIEVDFRKTNYKGLWQIRRCEVDPASIRYEISLKNRF